jgi:hypothetical protein
MNKTLVIHRVYRDDMETLWRQVQTRQFLASEVSGVDANRIRRLIGRNYVKKIKRVLLKSHVAYVYQIGDRAVPYCINTWGEDGQKQVPQ